jgi:hypothetical protein
MQKNLRNRAIEKAKPIAMTLQDRAEKMEHIGWVFDFYLCGNEVSWVAVSPTAHDSGTKNTITEAIEYAEKQSNPKG